MKTDKSEFRFSETFNNTDGKTSGSGFAGIMITIIGTICFVTSMVGYFLQIPNTLEVMSNIVIFIGLGSALLGVRKIKGNNNIIKNNE